ncbi:transposase, partial [Elizabethkingia argentiflava]
ISVSDYYIVDSMPLEICKLSRSSRSTVCRENYFTSPDKGFCASQNSVYYGYKLHAVCTTDEIFTDFDVTQACVHDIHYLKDIKHL